MSSIFGERLWIPQSEGENRGHSATLQGCPMLHRNEAACRNRISVRVDA